MQVELIRKISDFLDNVFKSENVSKHESELEESNSEHYLLKFPLRIFTTKDVPIISTDDHSIDQKKLEYLNQDYCKKNSESEFKEEIDNISAMIEGDNELKCLKKKIEWLNVSFWCVIGGRMPVIAAINAKNEFIDYRVEKFNKIWQTYIANTTYLSGLYQSENELNKNNPKAQIKILNTINALICEESRNRIPLHIKFNSDNSFDKDKKVLNIDSKLLDNIQISDLSVESQTFWQTIKNKDNCSFEGWDDFKNEFDLNDSKYLYDDEIIKEKIATILYNISLWNKFYRDNGKTLIENIYLIPVSIDRYSYTSFENMLDFKKGNPVSILAIGTNQELDGKEFEFMRIFTDLVLTKVLMLNFNKAINIKDKKQFLALVKVAIAAIMSRNGSHNIGSHVLAKVSSKFNEVPDSQILFKYIQQRMDFVAQITTEFPEWTYPAWFIRDVMRRFYMQRTLLNYIAESESLNAYEFQGINSGKGNFLIKILDKDFNEIVSEKDDQPGKEIKNDVQIAIPGGTVGVHAFYTILENIIRNSAKHAWKKELGKKFELYIRLVDDEKKDYVTLQIFDNCTENKVVDEKSLIKNMNDKIKKSFIDEFGVLKKENWGIAEIKISVGYLNKEKLEFIGGKGEQLLYDPSKNKGLVRFCEIDNTKNNTKYYGYEFSIPKPKEVLIITEDVSLLNIKEDAKKYNVHITESLPKDLDYEFVIINDKIYQDIKDGKLSIENLPFRIFLPGNNIEERYKYRILPIEEIVLNDFDKFKLELYKKWIDEFLLKGNNEQKYIYINTEGDTKDLHSLDSSLIMLPYLFNINKDTLIDRKFLTNDEFNEVLKTITDEINKTPQKNIRFSNIVKSLNQKINKENLIFYLKTLIENFINFSKKYEEDIETLPKIFRANGGGEKRKFPKFIQRNNNLILPLNFKLEESGKESTFLKTMNDQIEKNTYIFLRHCEIYSNNLYKYKEALSGSQFYFSLLESEQTPYNANKLLLQLIESATMNVLIIDERVAEYFYSMEDKIKMRFIAANIIIPSQLKYSNGEGEVEYLVQQITKEFQFQIIADFSDLKHINTGYKKESFVNEYGRIYFDKFDLLIIHQGVLDKLYHKKSIIEEKLNLIKESIPFIVITSGRGTPSELPDNEKFLPFSDLREFIMKPFHEKLLLINTVMKIISGRKKK